MRRQRQRHFGEVGVGQRRRVAELTQHLVERHAVLEAFDDMAAQLGPDLLPARHRRRHVAENGLDVLFRSHRHSSLTSSSACDQPRPVHCLSSFAIAWRTSSTPRAAVPAPSRPASVSR